MTLTEFLLARIGEDEAAARGSHGGDWSAGGVRMVPQPEGTDHWESVAPGWVLVEPRHVLAECEAKRRIVEMHGDDAVKAGSSACWWDDSGHCPTLCTLALPYTDHPDYNVSWRV